MGKQIEKIQPRKKRKAWKKKFEPHRCEFSSFELRASREGAKGKGREEENKFDTDSDSDSDSDIDIDTEIFELEIILMQVGSPHHN